MFLVLKYNSENNRNKKNVCVSKILTCILFICVIISNLTYSLQTNWNNRRSASKKNQRKMMFDVT